MLILDELDEGDIIYHPIHNIVKFVSYHGWYCYILVYTPKRKKVNGEIVNYWEWDKIVVCTHKLKQYDKAKHGELHDFTNRLK